MPPKTKTNAGWEILATFPPSRVESQTLVIREHGNQIRVAIRADGEEKVLFDMDQTGRHDLHSALERIGDPGYR